MRVRARVRIGVRVGDRVRVSAVRVRVSTCSSMPVAAMVAYSGATARARAWT